RSCRTGPEGPGHETLPPGLCMRTTDYLLVPAACVLYGITQPLSRVLIDAQLPAKYLAAARMISVAVVFLGWILLRYRDQVPRGRELGMLLIFCIVGIVCLQWIV